MSYTSGQYKYLLLQLLRRHMTMYDADSKCYTQSFFYKLFDESIVVDEAAYNGFVNAVEEQMQYCADHNVTHYNDITQQMMDDSEALLQDAFANVGIQVTFGNRDDGKATFVKPNGETMVYYVGSKPTNYFYINAVSNTEYNYSSLSYPYYNFQDKQVLDIDEINPRIAGPGTYWKYGASTKTLSITGNGILQFVPSPYDNTTIQLCGGLYDTLIIGANVSRLYKASLFPLGGTGKMITIVVLHSKHARLIMDPLLCNSASGDTSTSNKNWTIYCDNLNFRNYAWPSKIKITWKSLDEWNG